MVANNVVTVWHQPGAVALLRRLWIDGFPCSDMATRISREIGWTVSSNGVIGKVHRMGLNKEYPRGTSGGSEAQRVTGAIRSRAKQVKRATKRIPSLGKAPAVTGIDYRRIPGTEETAAQCAAYGRDRVAWVEAGAGVVSLNARPFFEGSGCKWPLADGMRCCNEISRGQYCSGHASVAYERATKGPSAAILTRHDGVLDKYRAAGPESTAWDEARLAA